MNILSNLYDGKRQTFVSCLNCAKCFLSVFFLCRLVEGSFFFQVVLQHDRTDRLRQEREPGIKSICLSVSPSSKRRSCVVIKSGSVPFPSFCGREQSGWPRVCKRFWCAHVACICLFVCTRYCVRRFLTFICLVYKWYILLPGPKILLLWEGLTMRRDHSGHGQVLYPSYVSYISPRADVHDS